MSGNENRAGLWPADGAGVLAQQGGLTLLSSLPDTRLPDQLLDLLIEVADAGGDGLRFTQAVEAALEADGSWRLSREGREGPAVVAFGETGGGLAICVTGAAWAEITTSHGTHDLVGWQPAILLRCLVGCKVLTVRGGLGGGHRNEARTDRFSRLDSGVVRAGGFLYHVAQDGPDTPRSAEVSSDAHPVAPAEAGPDGAAEHVTAMARPTESPRETRAELREPVEPAAGTRWRDRRAGDLRSHRGQGRSFGTRAYAGRHSAAVQFGAAPQRRGTRRCPSARAAASQARPGTREHRHSCGTGNPRRLLQERSFRRSGSPVLRRLRHLDEPEDPGPADWPSPTAWPTGSRQRLHLPVGHRLRDRKGADAQCRCGGRQGPAAPNRRRYRNRVPGPCQRSS